MAGYPVLSVAGCGQMTPPRRVREGASEVVDRLRRRHDEVCQGIYAHVEARVPAPRDQRDYERRLGVERAIDALVGYGLDELAGGGRCERPIPEAALDQARYAARVGVSLGTLVRRYIAADARLGEYVADHWEFCTSQGHSVCIRQLRRIQESALERLIAAVVRAYEAERDKYCQITVSKDTELIERLLRDEATACDERETLGYRFDWRWHIGLIGSGGQWSRTFRAVQEHLRCEVLLTGFAGDLVRAWIGSDHQMESKALDGLLPGELTAVAVGEPRHGFAGWQRTEHEAHAAWPVVVTSGRAVVHCADVTVEAALLRSDGLATLHQETYLWPLDSVAGGGKIARETLQAYLDCQGNVALMSTQLRVDPRTVGKRLRAIEGVLGQSVHACLPQISFALRLEALVGSRADVPV
jgi:PucR C-terminal helix-turn-helix domain